MTVHPHLPNLHGDEQGSPWRLLPAIALVLALAAAILIVADFGLAHLIAGRSY